MLNGIDPIIIFEFSKLTPDAEASVAKIPIVSSIVSAIGLPPIPIYLSEKLTGLYIDSEDRNIEIQTTVETLANGASPITNQKAINSTTSINMIANKNSIGLTLLSALCDLVVPKVSSKEYTITYLHGSVTIFRGLLHSFAVTQSAENDLLNIKLELTKNNETKKASVPEVSATPEAATLDGGLAPTAPVGGAGATGSGLQGPPPQPAAPPPVSLAPLG